MENLKKNHLKLEFEESFPIGAEREKMVYNYLAKNNNVNSALKLGDMSQKFKDFD